DKNFYSIPPTLRDGNIVSPELPRAKGDVMKSHMLACVLLLAASPLSAAPSDQVVKFACDTELKVYKGKTPGTYPLRGVYLEIGRQQIRVLGTSAFDGTYSEDRSDERVMYLRHPSNPLYGGSINRINGDLSLVKWSDGNKSQAEMLVSGACRPYKPLF
ncbi:MAG TPA: hypothetical protein VJM78_06970, partial [Rhizomicrobium sp.]|nr:hypothetical protein [Rhizomicrobium sp.]